MPSQLGAHHLLQQLRWPAEAGSGICVAGASAWEGEVQGEAEGARVHQRGWGHSSQSLH